MFRIENARVQFIKLEEKSDKLIVGTAYSFSKDKQGEYQTTFINCKIVGNALVSLIELGIKEKEYCKVTGAIGQENWTNNEGEKRSKLSLTVFELAKWEHDDKKSNKNNKNNKRSFK